MVPEVESRVDLEQVQTPVRTALEIALGDAAKVDTAKDLAPHLGDVVRRRNRDRRAVATFGGIRPDLAAGELAHSLALAVDVGVVTLDAGLGARDKLLGEHIRLELGDTRPQ